MATIGRWGITRDEKGELANLYAWPWYWRYPAMVLGIACLIAFLVSQAGNGSTKQETVILVMCGLAALWLLSVTYELAKLMLMISLLWGGWKLIGAVVPDSWKPVGQSEIAELRDEVANAYYLAEQANTAAQATADELEDAQVQIAEANAAAAEAQAHSAELESRLDAICITAPALCY